MGLLLLFLPIPLAALIFGTIAINRYAQKQIQDHPATRAYHDATARGDILGAVRARDEMNRAMTPHANRAIYVVVGIIAAAFWILMMMGSNP